MVYNKETFVINGIEWDIVRVGTGHISLTHDGHDNLGTTYNQTCTIYLDDKMPKSKLKRVLMHELVHALIDSMGFCFAEMDEEQVADFMAAHAEKIVKLANRYMEREYRR